MTYNKGLIKKIIIFSICLFTLVFSNIKDTNASFELPTYTKEVTATINTHILGETDEIATETVQAIVRNTLAVEVENTNTFVAIFVDGYLFDNGKVGNNGIVAKTNDFTIDIYYVLDGFNLVIATNSSKKLIGLEAVSTDAALTNYETWEELVLNNVPIGYEFEKFVSSNGDFDKDAVLTSSMIIKAKLKRLDIETSFVIRTASTDPESPARTIDNPNPKFDETVTVTSNNPNFRYWVVDGKIVSYKKNYTFTVFGNVDLIEVVNEESMTMKAVINQYKNQELLENNLYVFGFDLPNSTFVVLEAGIITGGRSLNFATNKYVANVFTENNEFAIKKNLNGETAIGYLIFKTGDTISVVYSTGNIELVGKGEILTGSANSPVVNGTTTTVTSNGFSNKILVNNYLINQVEVTNSYVFKDRDVQAFRFSSSSGKAGAKITAKDGFLINSVTITYWSYGNANVRIEATDNTETANTLLIAKTDLAPKYRTFVCNPTKTFFFAPTSASTNGFYYISNIEIELVADPVLEFVPFN